MIGIFLIEILWCDASYLRLSIHDKINRKVLSEQRLRLLLKHY